MKGFRFFNFGFWMILIIILIPFTSASGEIIENNKVIVDDALGHMELFPNHIIKDSWIYANITSKSYTGKLNMIGCFESDNAIPKDIQVKNGDDYISVTSLFSRIDVPIDNKDMCYIIKNFDIVADIPINFKFYLDLIDGYGKYDIAFYPASYGENYIAAYNAGNMFLIDPTYNLNNEVVAYYPFTTDASDSVGVNDGIVTGATLTTGIIDNSYVFAGADKIDLTTSPKSGTGNFSISAWVKYTDTGSAYRKIVFLGNTASNAGAYITKNTNDGKLAIGIWGSANIVSPSAYNDDNWHFVVGTFAQSDLDLYIDGVLVVSGSKTYNLATTYKTIGYGYSSDYWIGNIDEIGIFNTKLNQTQIDFLYNNGKPTLSQQYEFTDYTPWINFTYVSANNDEFYDNKIFGVNDINFIANFTIYLNSTYSFNDYSSYNFTNLANDIYNITFSYYYNDSLYYNSSSYTFYVNSQETETNLETNTCPDTTPKSLILVLFFSIALFLMFISLRFQTGLFGIFGSLLLIFTSWVAIGCYEAIGGLLFYIGLFSLAYFTFIVPSKFK